MAKDKLEKFGEITAIKCWPDAEKMLRAKVSGLEVARYIHNQGEMLHRTVATIARQLLRYREERIKPLALVSLIDDVVRGQSLDLNDIDELTKIILLQKQRVDRDIEYELRMPHSVASMTKEVVILFDLIERRYKLLQDSGAAPRAPQQHLHAIVDETPYRKVLAGLPEGQREALREEIALGYADEGSGVLPGQYRVVDEDDGNQSPDS